MINKKILFLAVLPSFLVSCSTIQSTKNVTKKHAIARTIATSMESVLVDAIKLNKLSLVKAAIDEGADVTNKSVDVALRDSIKDIDYEIAETIYSKRFEAGETLKYYHLSNALEKRRSKIAKLLIEGGVSLDTGEYTPMLVHAAYDLELTKLLVGKGEDVNAYSTHEWTKGEGIYRVEYPLLTAVQSGNLDVVKYLIEQGAKPSLEKVDRDYTVISAAAYNLDRKMRIKLLDYLIDVAEIDINILNGIGQNVFSGHQHKSYRWSLPDDKTLEYLITKGADINSFSKYKDISTNSPVRAFIKQGYYCGANKLINAAKYNFVHDEKIRVLGENKNLIADVLYSLNGITRDGYPVKWESTAISNQSRPNPSDAYRYKEAGCLNSLVKNILDKHRSISLKGDLWNRFYEVNLPLVFATVRPLVKMEGELQDIIPKYGSAEGDHLQMIKKSEEAITGYIELLELIVSSGMDVNEKGALESEYDCKNRRRFNKNCNESDDSPKKVSVWEFVLEAAERDLAVLSDSKKNKVMNRLSETYNKLGLKKD